MIRLVPCFVAACLLLTALPARAEECPDNIPTASRERRALAKEWFSRAEAADAAQDPIGAVKAYQCSLKMVPHAFTAFNLGRLAERTGDLELAVEAFGTYMKLAPEAPDRAEIEAKITALGQRIEALRAEQAAAAQPPVNPPPRPPATDPVPDLKPPVAAEPPPPPPPSDETGSGETRLLPWIIGGAGVVALGAGIALNLSARNKMDDCRALAARQQLMAADAACDAAPPRAYASYALFGVAAAAAVTDGVLLWLMHGGSSERAARAPHTIAATPLPGGALVSGRLRF